MALTRSNLRLWYKMFTGQSILHVNQGLGKCFSPTEIRGYYNDLTEKVTRLPHLLGTDVLPTLAIGGGQHVEFAVGIFQYGLGAYDLYLTTGGDVYKTKFQQSLKWACDHQEASGAWKTFQHIYPDHPYGAMCQGEGVSLLLRGYISSHQQEYIDRAHRAIDFMLTSVTEGGTTLYQEEDVVFREYPHRRAVLNGWIFAWFGLYDYVLVCQDKGKYQKLLDASCKTMLRHLPTLSRWYWSKYDFAGRVASPFYHNLHIALMQAMYQLTHHEEFKQYAEKWARCSNNPFKKGIAISYKSIQKIFEKKVP